MAEVVLCAGDDISGSEQGRPACVVCAVWLILLQIHFWKCNVCFVCGRRTEELETKSEYIN